MAEHRQLGARPALLLIAGSEPPAPEIMRVSQRCHAPIRRLTPDDDLDRLLEEVRPVAIAWDVSGASDSEWMLIQRLRMHPLLCQAPFLLYGMEARRPTAGGRRDQCAHQAGQHSESGRCHQCPAAQPCRSPGAGGG